MQDTDHIVALHIPEPDEASLSPETQAYFAKCREKLGMVPNVLRAYAFDEAKLTAFSLFYNDLMLAPSGLSKAEREMIAVVVSAENRCVYCLTAHGAGLRALTGAPALAEVIAQNYRAAPLPPRLRVMLDFAVKLTNTPQCMAEADRQALRDVGFEDRDIWDIASVAAFFNMSNRVAAAVEMQPNPDYHHMARNPVATG